MTKAELLQTIEAVNGPDRILDAMIAADLAGLCLHGSWHTEGPDGDRGRVCDDCGADSWGNLGKHGQRLNDPLPAYTASIDAALALVERLLPGWAWFVDWIGMPDQPACHAEVWLPAQRSQHLGRERERGEASTPALAILAALLHALIAKEAEHGSEGTKP